MSCWLYAVRPESAHRINRIEFNAVHTASAWVIGGACEWSLFTRYRATKSAPTLSETHMTIIAQALRAMSAKRRCGPAPPGARKRILATTHRGDEE